MSKTDVDAGVSRSQSKVHVPANAQRCARCTILIFDDSADVPNYLSPTLHQAHGEYCSECVEFIEK